MNRFGATDNFWSSEGSITPDATEHLIYGIAGTDQTQILTTDAVDLGKVAQIYSFTIAVFNPSNLQGVGHDYPPRQVQLEVGFTKHNFHYKSPIFEVLAGTSTEQEFIILPILVIGSHLKVNLIGKPCKQDGMDDKYY